MKNFMAARKALLLSQQTENLKDGCENLKDGMLFFVKVSPHFNLILSFSYLNICFFGHRMCQNHLMMKIYILSIIHQFGDLGGRREGGVTLAANRPTNIVFALKD